MESDKPTLKRKRETKERPEPPKPKPHTPEQLELIRKALANERLAREPSDADKQKFKAAFAEGGKGYCWLSKMFLPRIRRGIITLYEDALSQMCPNWSTCGINGSMRCGIVKHYGAPSCGWGPWIVRRAYIQFLQSLLEDDRPYAVSIDGWAFGIKKHSNGTSTTTEHVDMSPGSPSFKLEIERRKAGEPFPNVQAQVSLCQKLEGSTKLMFGPLIELDKVPANKTGKDYNKLSGAKATEFARVKSGRVVFWRSNVVHCTKKAGKTSDAESDLDRLGQFVCAYPQIYRSKAALKAKRQRVLDGMGTGHLPTQCVPDGARNHMSNKSKCVPRTSKRKGDAPASETEEEKTPETPLSYCYALPQPTLDSDLFKFAATML